MVTHEERMEALEAGRILQSSVFSRAFERLDELYVQAWRSSSDSAEREKWWYMQRVLADVKKELFEFLQCAAIKNRGKDETLNAALNAVKEKKNGRKS